MHCDLGRYFYILIIAPSEPNAYLSIDLDVTKSLGYLHKLNENSEVKHTMTHLVTRAMGIGLERFPEINGNLAFGNVSERLNQSSTQISELTSACSLM